MNHREEGLLLSLDIKSYIEHLKEFKHRSMETANPKSIKERVEENLIPHRVMEVLMISKVIASLTRACKIYLSEAAQYLMKTWITTVVKSNLILINLYLEIFALEKKRNYILSMTLFKNEVKIEADCKLILVDLNSRNKVKQLQIIRTSESKESNHNEEEKHQCQDKINQQLIRCGKFSASEQTYTTSIYSNLAELLEKCVVQKDYEDVWKTEATWKYKHSIKIASLQKKKRLINEKDRELRSNNALVSTIVDQETIPGKECRERDMTQQQIIHETQQASSISRGAKSSKVKTVRSWSGQNKTDQAKASEEPKSGINMYMESNKTKTRCVRDNDKCTSCSKESGTNTSTMQQVITPDEYESNEVNWRQQRTFDKENQQTSPMSRGAKNSVQHDIISTINNILPMRKKQTNWERRQNEQKDYYQPMTRRARAIVADLNQQSRMTTSCENQIKESHSGLKEAERRCIEKSMYSSREYQFIYSKAINNTTIDTNNKTSICHKEPIEDRYYYVTVGMTDKPVQQRQQQQQQSECAHANRANDRAGANFQGNNNSMSQQHQSTTSRYTYNYAADMYDSIDNNVLISHESRGGNMQQSVVGSHTSVDDTKSTAMHSRYSVTLTTTAEKKEMRRQTQTDRSSERSSSADHKPIMVVATKRILKLFISNNTTEEVIVQEQSATKYNNATKSNNYSIIQMSKEDTMDKALKLQLSDNEVSDEEMTKSSKSYLIEQHILADGYSRELTSALKRQEVTSPKGTIILKSVQNNSTVNRQRKNESNQYLYEEVTREIAEEERSVVTKLTQMAANKPNESKTMMATLSKQEANDRTAFTANISKETSILSNIPAKITNKKGTEQDEQLKRREEPVEELKEAKQDYQTRTQLSINEAFINSNLYRRESEVKSAIDEREFNNLPKQQELKSSEESKMEQDNKSTAKFTNKEMKNQKDYNIRASYLLQKDGKPKFNSIETKGSQHACTDESRRQQISRTTVHQLSFYYRLHDQMMICLDDH